MRDDITASPPGSIRDPMLRSDQSAPSLLFGSVDTSDIQGRSLRGVGVTLPSQLAKLGLQTGATILLGRLLLPTDFGLVAMVAVVTNFIALFKDAGLAQATVQREVVSQAQVSCLFWLNAILSTGLAVAVVACAPLLVWFFGDSRLLGLTMVLSVPLVLSGLSLQHRALLQRNMRFGDIARAEVLGMGFGGVIGVACALQGLGVWSLALMQVANVGASSAIIWALADWKPGRLARATGVCEMLGFGLNLSGFSLVNYFSRNADKFLIGKIVGVSALGQYSLAYRFLLLPISQINGPISSVLLPALSRLRTDRRAYEALYLRYTRWIAWLTVVPIASATFWGEPVIAWMLGEPWREAGRLFEILAIASMLQPVSNLAGVLFTSAGETKKMFHWGIFAALVTVSGFLVALPYGAVGIATSYAITASLLAVLCWGFAAKVCSISFRGILRAVIGPVGLGLGIVTVALLC